MAAGVDYPGVGQNEVDESDVHPVVGHLVDEARTPGLSLDAGLGQVALSQFAASIRAQFSEVTPAQQKTLEAGFDEMRARFDAMEKDGRAELVRSLQTQRAAQVRARDAAMAEFEKVIPLDPRVLIASRLRRFLDLSRDIDYSAKLVERDKKMRFADPALESKPRDWKLCFRAGKAATDTARAFAQKWLSDLEARGVK